MKSHAFQLLDATTKDACATFQRFLVVIWREGNGPKPDPIREDKLRKIVALVLIALTSAGCVEATAEPTIGEFNGDSVRILQTNILGEGKRYEATDAEANRACGMRGRRAEFASHRQSPANEFQWEYLYLCV